MTGFRHYFTVPIAAFFLQVGRAVLEPLGRFDDSIDYPLHPSGCGAPELSVAGLLVPWIAIVGAPGFLAAWLVAAILERTGLSRHVWHLPPRVFPASSFAWRSATTSRCIRAPSKPWPDVRHLDRDSGG